MNEGECHVGKALIVSQDKIATQQITTALQDHGLSVEVSVSAPLALDRIARHKFEAVIVDSAIDGGIARFLIKLRASASNRTAVAFALTTGQNATTSALSQGFSFVLERPLTPESVIHTLRVAFGLIVRERRRYFRHPIEVPVALRRNGDVIYGRTLNVSERGMAVRSSTPVSTGEKARAEFTLDHPDLHITADLRVCWSKENGDAGLSFTFLPHDLASELQTWLGQKLEEKLPQAVVEKFRHPRT
jgi:CheY-like chemotaxis protein